MKSFSHRLESCTHGYFAQTTPEIDSNLFSNTAKETTVITLLQATKGISVKSSFHRLSVVDYCGDSVKCAMHWLLAVRIVLLQVAACHLDNGRFPQRFYVTIHR